MRRLLAALLLLLPTGLAAQPQPLGPIWRSGARAIVLTQCPPGDHDDHCRAVVARGDDGAEVRLGAGYIVVRLLWSRAPGQPAGDGPDALVLGDDGGSGGDADLFAVSFTAAPVVRRLGGERYDTVKVAPGPGPLRLTLPFDIEYFNGAPHAGAIVLPLPARWVGGDVAVDLAALERPGPAPAELAFRRLALREELRRWASDAYPAQRLFPPEARQGTPVTVTALVELMLAGHADQARALLRDTWPGQQIQTDRPLGGEDAFWAALCAAVVREPGWTRFGLARLLGAASIAGAAAR